MARRLVIFLATAGYAGLSPVAPGTAGSVVGLAIAWLLAPTSARWPMPFVISFMILFAAACWISGRAEVIFDEHDSSKIVIDEVFGMIATMFLNPVHWTYLLAGFLLFRLFDIIKPFPADLIDRRVSGGAGVMLDDLAAAVYANLVLRAIGRFL